MLHKYNTTDAKKYFQNLKEQLDNSDGMISVVTPTPLDFLEAFHSYNPFMKIELKMNQKGRYDIHVISGG